MKCPKCGEELSLTPMSMCIDKSYQKKNFCFKCMKRYSDREIEDLEDAEKIEEDTEIWLQFRKYK